MKRTIPLLIFCILFLSACSQPEILRITGDGAAEQVIEISSDPEEYLGKTVYFAGYYSSELFFGNTYHYVLLDSGEDQNLGFEIRWDGDYPEPGTAVSVTGILSTETVYGQAYIFLQISELNILQPVNTNTK